MRNKKKDYTKASYESMSARLIQLQWEINEREDEMKQIGEALQQVELSLSLDLRTIKDRGIKLVDAFS